MPTDRGLKLLKPPAVLAEQAYTMPVTGPISLEKRVDAFSWLAVGVGLHLLSPAFAGMVAIVSLAATKRLPALLRPDGRLAYVTPAAQTSITAPRGFWRFARNFTG
jgi:hypothetical protein